MAMIYTNGRPSKRYETVLRSQRFKPNKGVKPKICTLFGYNWQRSRQNTWNMKSTGDVIKNEGGKSMQISEIEVFVCNVKIIAVYNVYTRLSVYTPV